MLDEGLLREPQLDPFLIIDLLLVDRLEEPQIVLVAALQRAVQFEEALFRLGERLDQVEEFRARFHATLRLDRNRSGRM